MFLYKKYKGKEKISSILISHLDFFEEDEELMEEIDYIYKHFYKDEKILESLLNNSSIKTYNLSLIHKLIPLIKEKNLSTEIISSIYNKELILKYPESVKTLEKQKNYQLLFSIFNERTILKNPLKMKKLENITEDVLILLPKEKISDVKAIDKILEIDKFLKEMNDDFIEFMENLAVFIYRDIDNDLSIYKKIYNICEKDEKLKTLIYSFPEKISNRPLRLRPFYEELLPFIRSIINEIMFPNKTFLEIFLKK